jgi:hypothetical protein
MAGELFRLSVHILRSADELLKAMQALILFNYDRRSARHAMIRAICGLAYHFKFSSYNNVHDKSLYMFNKLREVLFWRWENYTRRLRL